MFLLILGLQPCCNNDIYFLTYLVLTTMLRRIIHFLHADIDFGCRGSVSYCSRHMSKIVGFRFKFVFNTRTVHPIV